MADKIDMMRKIRKLLFKAADSRTPLHERTTARAIAEKLLSKHKITEIEVLASTEAEDIFDGDDSIGDSFINDILGGAHDLAGAIENKQDEIILKMAERAEKYVKENKESLKNKFGDWLDGLFK